MNRRDPWGTDDAIAECDRWVFEDGVFKCRGGGGISLPAIEVNGEPETDPALQRAARQFVKWLLDTHQAYRIGSESALTRSPSSKVAYSGYVVNAFVGLGGTAAIGGYRLSNGWTGIYVRGGLGNGFDLSGGGEVGGSTSLDALSGGATEGASNLGPVNGSISINDAGQSLAGGLAFGPTEIFLGGHLAYTFTLVSDPHPGGTVCVTYWLDWVCK